MVRHPLVVAAAGRAHLYQAHLVLATQVMVWVRSPAALPASHRASCPQVQESPESPQNQPAVSGCSNLRCRFCIPGRLPSSHLGMDRLPEPRSVRSLAMASVQSLDMAVKAWGRLSVEYPVGSYVMVWVRHQTRLFSVCATARRWWGSHGPEWDD
jgi:hypothetical protein